MKRRRRSWKRTCGCGCLGVIGTFLVLVFGAALLPPVDRTSRSVPMPTLMALADATDRPAAPIQPSATITDTPQPQPTARFVMFYVARNTPINVRATASASADVLGQLPPGAPVPVLEAVDGDAYNGSTHWYRVSYNGAQGYVHGSLLADHPVTPPPTAMTRPVAPTSAPVQQQPVNPLPQGNVSSGDPFGCNHLDDLNCSDFKKLGINADAHLQLCGDDDDNLDAEGDGRACESN